MAGKRIYTDEQRRERARKRTLEYQRAKRATPEGRELLCKRSLEYRRAQYATPEGRERILAANRAANMSPERLERRRAYDRERRRPANLTPEQLKLHHASARVRVKTYYDKPETKAKLRKQQAMLYADDVQYRLGRILRARINKVLKGHCKPGSSVRDLGCSIAEFKEHIERQFKPGMSWANWSWNGWHLDHRRPLAFFDLANRDEFLVAVHFSNYQPLWATENHAKGARWDDTASPS